MFPRVAHCQTSLKLHPPCFRGSPHTDKWTSSCSSHTHIRPTLHMHRPQTQKRTIPFLFVRGDGVILISPPLRS